MHRWWRQLFQRGGDGGLDVIAVGLSVLLAVFVGDEFPGCQFRGACSRVGDIGVREFLPRRLPGRKDGLPVGGFRPSRRNCNLPAARLPHHAAGGDGRGPCIAGRLEVGRGSSFCLRAPLGPRLGDGLIPRGGVTGGRHDSFLHHLVEALPGLTDGHARRQRRGCDRGVEPGRDHGGAVRLDRVGQRGAVATPLRPGRCHHQVNAGLAPRVDKFPYSAIRRQPRLVIGAAQHDTPAGRWLEVP